jgi:hypothetical protein
VGNDWLTKTNGVIDFNHKVMELNYNNRKIWCGITYWKKSKFNDNGIPTGVEEIPTKDNKIWDEELEDEKEDTTTDQQYCVLLGNSNEKPLMEMDQHTIMIGDREEPIEYIQELNQLKEHVLKMA